MKYSYDTEYLDLSELYFYVNDKCYSVKDVWFKVNTEVTPSYNDGFNDNEDLFVEDAKLNDFDYSLYEWDENGYEHDVELKNLPSKEYKKINDIVESMLNDFINDYVIGHDLSYTDNIIDEISDYGRAYEYLKFWSKEPKYYV